MRRCQLIMLVMSVCIGIVGLVDVGRLARAQSGTATPKTLVVTSLKGDGPGSLQAIYDAASPGDTITFAGGLSGVLETPFVGYAESSDLFIKKSISLIGPASRQISLNRNIGIAADASVYIENLVFMNSTNNFGRLLVKNSIYRPTSSIWNYPIGSLSIDGVTFEPGNTPLFLAEKTTTIIRNCLIFGGYRGVRVDIFKGARVSIINSTFDDNERLFALIDGTLVANTMETTPEVVGDGSLDIINSTIRIPLREIGNQSVFEGNASFTLIRLKNTIIARSLELQRPLGKDALQDALKRQQIVDPDSKLLILDEGNNLVSPGLSVTFPTGDARLGPLQDNGGPTKTIALLPGSDGIGKGDLSTCDGPLVAGQDQRGFRIVAKGQTAVSCDIGAFQTGAYQTSP